MAKSNETSDLNCQTSGDVNSDAQDLNLVAYDESLGRLGGDVELFKEFVQIFYEDSPQLLEKMFVAVDATDHDSVAKSAHAFKGLVSNFGAKPCCELALEFELAGKNKTSETMVGQKERMQHLYDLLCSELKHYAA